MHNLGSELLNNEHFLSSLNIYVTRYVHAEIVKALDGNQKSVTEGNQNNSNTGPITALPTDLSSLRQEMDTRLVTL